MGSRDVVQQYGERTGLSPQWARWIKAVVALVGVLVLFAFVFGLNAVTSVQIWPLEMLELNSGGQSSSARADIGYNIAVTVIAVGGFGFAVGSVGASRRWSLWDTTKTVLLQRPPAAAWLGAFGLFLLAGLVSGSAAHSIGELTGHVPQREEVDSDGAGEIAAQWLSLISAGFKEELVIVAVPVLLLVVAGRGSFGLAITLSMLMRLVIHLYYGPGSFAYLFWAGVGVVLYLYGRSLMPLIAAHVWWNVGVGLEMFGFITATQLNVVTIVVGFGAFAFACTDLDSVSTWASKNPWDLRLGKRRTVHVRPEQQVRRRKALRVVGWAAVDTSIAILSIGLGVITGVKSLSTVNQIVFIMIGVVSALILYVADKFDVEWPTRPLLVLNITYYGAVGSALAAELAGGGPEKAMDGLAMSFYLVGCVLMIFMLGLAKHGTVILPDKPKGVDREH